MGWWCGCVKAGNICVLMCVCVCVRHACKLVLGDDHRLLMCSMIILCYNFLTTPNAKTSVCIYICTWCGCCVCVRADISPKDLHVRKHSYSALFSFLCRFWVRRS